MDFLNFYEGCSLNLYLPICLVSYHLFMPVIYCIIHERFVKFAPRSEPPHIENPNLTPGPTPKKRTHQIRSVSMHPVPFSTHFHGADFPIIAHYCCCLLCLLYSLIDIRVREKVCLAFIVAPASNTMLAR